MSTQTSLYALLAQLAALESLAENLTRCNNVDDVRNVIHRRMTELDKHIKHLSAKQGQTK